MMKMENLEVEQLDQSINDVPEAIVLVGVPGSGKSTWVKNHLGSSTKEYTVLSSDAIIERIASEKGLKYSDVYRESIGYATSKAKQEFRESINSGLNVIIDQTNVSKKKRRGVLQQLPKNYRKIAVVFQTEDKEVERRLIERAAVTGKHIPDFVMKDMYDRWEAPTRDEGFDLIIKA